MRTRGFHQRIVPRPWTHLLAEFESLAATSPWFEPMVAIIRSVIESGNSGLLAASTSMHDLIVVTAPPPTPPFDALRISVSGSLDHPPAGQVRIRHVSVSVHDDDISRPESEAVALFWRFAIEKFGMPSGGDRIDRDGAV